MKRNPKEPPAGRCEQGLLEVLGEIGGFWSALATGRGLQVESPCAAIEEVPGPYNVGEIVRDYTHAWLGVEPNYATPADILDLLLFLDDMTEALALAAGNISWMDPDSQDQLKIDLERWQNRLNEYLLETAAVPIEQSGDRRAILWTVTAPLFLGWYGGPTGTEIVLPASDFPPGFNPELKHPPDLATPYQIANELNVFFDWEQERRRRLVKDVTKPFTAGTKAAFPIGAVAVGAAAIYLLTRK